VKKVFKRVIERPSEGWYVIQEIEDADGTKRETKFAGPYPTRQVADAILVGNIIQ